MTKPDKNKEFQFKPEILQYILCQIIIHYSRPNNFEKQFKITITRVAETHRGESNVWVPDRAVRNAHNC